jgi:hypothetical protein
MNVFQLLFSFSSFNSLIVKELKLVLPSVECIYMYYSTNEQHNHQNCVKTISLSQLFIYIFENSYFHQIESVLVASFFHICFKTNGWKIYHCFMLLVSTEQQHDHQHWLMIIILWQIPILKIHSSTIKLNLIQLLLTVISVLPLDSDIHQIEIVSIIPFSSYKSNG